MTDTRSMIRYGVVRHPGIGDDGIRDVLGEPELSESAVGVIEAMVSEGEIVRTRGVIGRNRFGFPVRGPRYYPTELATSRLLLEYIISNPECDEYAVNLYLAPEGGVPNWAETDIERLESAGLIEVGRKGVSVEGTDAVVSVRTFSPAAGVEHDRREVS